MNALYDQVREWLLTANLNWLATDPLLVAWTGKPIFEPDQRFVSDIVTVGGDFLAASEDIIGPTVGTGGYAQTTPALFRALPIGPPITWFTLCLNAPILDNAQLVAFIDVGVNLPYSPNGLDVLVQPDWLQSRGWFRP
jgi:hypothetical protein